MSEFDRENSLANAEWLWPISRKQAGISLRRGSKPRPIMSRNWQIVSKAIQKLAAGLYPIKSEGMFPYETCYVLATDEEIQRINELSATMAVH